MTGHACAVAQASRSAVRWLTCDRAELPDALDWLAPEESSRLAGLRIAKRRDDYLLGRWTAKRAIAALLAPATPLAAIAVRAADDGAPEAFLDGAPLAFTISLSHSAGRALAAVTGAAAGAPLGADLEHIEPRSALLVADFFTADEAAQVAAQPQDQRDHAITLIWSAKESALKARRSGLREDPRRISVDLGSRRTTPDGAWRALELAVDGSRGALAGWWRDDASHVLTIVGTAEEVALIERIRHGTMDARISP